LKKTKLSHFWAHRFLKCGKLKKRNLIKEESGGYTEERITSTTITGRTVNYRPQQKSHQQERTVNYSEKM